MTKKHCELEPMTEWEWDRRRLMQTGRLDKVVRQEPTPDELPVVEPNNELKELKPVK